MSTKKVLLLGSGFVTKPTVQVLSDAGISVTVASRELENAQRLAQGIPHTTPISLDVNDSTALDEEVAKHNLVVSLIPYSHHVAVVKSAIKSKKHVVTTSYISPAMAELDKKTKEAGITVMNEIGLDPGLDHLYAVKMIDEVHKEGGKILSFLSYCGGLPAPEASDNPLGYRFSWSPRGVLLGLRNAGKWLEDGEVMEVSGENLMSTAKPYFTGYTGFAFQAYPNRDSTSYSKRYAIPEARNVIRGTLRYQGFSDFISVLVDIGFLSENKYDFLNEPILWSKVTQNLLGTSSDKESDLMEAIESKVKFETNTKKEHILAGLRWIGIFSNKEFIQPKGTPLDTLCATLEQKMQYEEGQRDMVMLQHKFEIEHKDNTKETRTSTLCEYGSPGHYSAMAKLVGVPCAVATMLILDGRINKPGILAPVTEELAKPLRTELLKYGIFMVEKTLA